MKLFTATITSKKGFTNGFSGRANNTAKTLVNETGEFAFLEGAEAPYTPVGGTKAVKWCIDVGAIEFRPFDWGKGYDVKISKRPLNGVA